jgi:hypothetical protein
MEAQKGKEAFSSMERSYARWKREKEAIPVSTIETQQQSMRQR